MKQLLSIIIFLPLLISAQTDSVYKGVKWETELSWDQVKAKAKAENKYIFLDCYATWCGPCKKMDREVYPDPRVAAPINKHFICVKVQFDTTAEDNTQVKSWYSEARRLKKVHNIQAMPTYLFFTPDAALVHMEIGYKDKGSLVRMAELARDPKKPLYYSLYQDYKQGKKEYKTLGALAIFTKNLIGDKGWANTMAKDYKENYLDKLEKEALLTKENLSFIFYFNQYMNSKDKLFKLCYEESEKVDSVKKDKDWAQRRFQTTIIREEIESNVLKNGKAFIKYPNWSRMQSRIAKKYKKVDAKLLVLDYQIMYYRSKFLDWSLYAKYKDEKIKLLIPKKYDEKKDGMFVGADLNTFGAWDVFLACSEPKILEKALEWIELAIQFVPNDEALLDTKANLLYKLGKKEEALLLEEKALRMNEENVAKSTRRPDPWIRECVEKMKRGEPTWPLPANEIEKP